MSVDDLPSDLRAVIAASIPSVAHLEAILLIASRPEARWTPDSISRELRSNRSFAEAQLADLARAGFIVEIDKSEYSLASDPSLIDLLGRLRAAYAQRRFSVINVIYSRPLEKIRDLADAFVIGAPTGPKRDDKK